MIVTITIVRLALVAAVAWALPERPRESGNSTSRWRHCNESQHPRVKLRLQNQTCVDPYDFAHRTANSLTISSVVRCRQYPRLFSIDVAWRFSLTAAHASVTRVTRYP